MKQASPQGAKSAEALAPSQGHASVGLALREIKETWQLNAICHPGLGPGQ